MASEDPALATRAPESDFHESHSKFAIPSQSTPVPPSTHAHLSEHCTTSAPLPAHHVDSTPSGYITTFVPRPIGASSDSEALNEIDVYVSAPSDYPTTPAKLLLILSNGAGHASVNNQLQADLFARHGYLTVMPDLFAGDSAPNSPPAPEAELTNLSWVESVKLKVAETAKAFALDMWLARQTKEKVLPRVRAALEYVRKDYADAVARGLYVVGYCFGGKYALILGGEGEEGEHVPVQCVVCAHGTMVEKADVEAVMVPVSLVCVEDDPLFPAAILEHGRTKWKETAVEHEVEIYPGVPHGFAVLGDYGTPDIAKAQEKAFTQILKWLDGH